MTLRFIPRFTICIASVTINRGRNRAEIHALLTGVRYSRRHKMAGVIPEKYIDLFDKKAFANLATLNPDGTPKVTPVWVDYDRSHVLVNSARGRRKDKNK